MAMGSGNDAGSAGNTALSAASPPAETPRTTASCGMLQPAFAKDSLFLVHRFEQRLYGREVKRFSVAQAEKPTMPQAFRKFRKHTVLQHLVEIDQHIAAADQIHFAEHTVRDQVVIGKRYSLLQEIAEHRQLITV